jgi:hypothetical protein
LQLSLYVGRNCTVMKWLPIKPKLDQFIAALWLYGERRLAGSSLSLCDVHRIYCFKYGKKSDVFLTAPYSSILDCQYFMTVGNVGKLLLLSVSSMLALSHPMVTELQTLDTKLTNTPLEECKDGLTDWGLTHIIGDKVNHLWTKHYVDLLWDHKASSVWASEKSWIITLPKLITIFLTKSNTKLYLELTLKIWIFCCEQRSNVKSQPQTFNSNKLPMATFQSHQWMFEWCRIFHSEAASNGNSS